MMVASGRLVFVLVDFNVYLTRPIVHETLLVNGNSSKPPERHICKTSMICPPKSNSINIGSK